MMLIRTLIALLFIFSFQVQAKDSCVSTFELREVEESNNLSQFVRSNTRHFWSWLKYREGESSRLKRLNQISGVLPGDMNAANFGFVETTDGYRREFVDLDDVAPRLPLMGVLTNAVVNNLARLEVKSKEKHAREISELIYDSVVQGIRGEVVKPPKILWEYMGMSPKEARKEAEKYVKGKTLKGGDKFNIDGKELKALRFTSKKEKQHFVEEVAKTLKVDESQILDVAIRPKERGGSTEQKRIWILVAYDVGTRIIELKEQVDSGTEAYQGIRISNARRVWEFQSQFNSAFIAEHLMGFAPLVAKVSGREYLVHQKEPTLLDVGALNRNDLLEVSQYDAYLLGLALRQQGLGVRALESVKEDFVDVLTDTSLSYYGLVRDFWKKER